MANMMHEEEKSLYDGDSMSICFDENADFQIETIRKSRRPRTNIIMALLIFGNLVFCALYINLRVCYARLQYEFRGLQPELFPCKRFTTQLEQI